MRSALFVLFALGLNASAAPPDLSELPGTLILADGWKPGAMPFEAFAELVEKAKDKAKKSVVVIAGPDDKTATLLEEMPLFKARPVTVLRKDKLDEKERAVLADAAGVWIASAKSADLAALKQVHAKGMIIGGDVIGLIPGFHGEKDAKPGLVGLAVEPDAGVLIRGRNLRVIGDASAKLKLARGAGMAAVNEPAKAGAMFDLFQLRRAAANRAEKEFFPPAAPAEPVVKKGTLVIIGGGGTTQQIMDAFFTAAGGKDALIVVIPTTEKDGPGDSGFLRKYGATNVKTLFTLDRKLANDPKFSEMLTTAGGVWFGGGRQWRFIDSFEGTLAEKRFHEVLARGGAIGGSSAGASIQSEYMPRGHPLGNTIVAVEGYEKGFGFLPGCAVDQHFFARKRTADMTGLMKLHPQFLGIGIDEATAIIVTGSTAEVMGKSKVAFFDTKKKPAEDKDYEEVFPGEKYDLKKRTKVK
jgi:cyanophycinase